MTALDPVTLEILRHAFSGIAEEMAVVEYRSSFSPIIREMLDFSCGTFDTEGRMISHAEQIPAQLGLMQFALAAAMRLGERFQVGGNGARVDQFDRSPGWGCRARVGVVLGGAVVHRQSG